MVFLSGAAELRPLRTVTTERTVDFSPVIVWDALIDPELADGWLGHLIIDAMPGVDSPSSFLTTSDADADDIARFWRGRLHLLAALLRGHPVDWRGSDRSD